MGSIRIGLSDGRTKLIHFNNTPPRRVMCGKIKMETITKDETKWRYDTVTHRDVEVSPEAILNTDDLIFSEDVIARIEQLTDRAETIRPLDSEEARELATLKAFAAQGEEWDAWKDGAELIRESHFTAWRQELAEESGELKDIPHYLSCRIDWAGVAQDTMANDHIAIVFDGVDYYISRH